MMTKRAILYFSLPLLFAATAMAQGMLTEIKVVAVQESDSLAPNIQGYTGADNFDLDFRKGRGGGYVFAVFKHTNDTAQYITDVVVTANRKDDYGMAYNDGDRKFIPAPFFQANARKDGTYRGGLNGRDYLCYGGAYSKQPHVYYTRSGNQDFNNKVLKDAYIATSRPERLEDNQKLDGPHAGGGRYFVFTWHTHESKYKSMKDINWHKHYCDRDNCGLTKIEPHKFPQLYGNDTWMILSPTGTAKDSLISQSHYKKCDECGQIVYDKHKWATFSSDWKTHNKRCLICDYVEAADHVSFGKQKLPVDEYSHMIFCADCGFLEKLRHEFSNDSRVLRQDCEHTLVEYVCKQCYHHANFEEPGIGHDFDDFGICRRKDCLHPYEQPKVETQGADSTYVIKTFGNLYWIADYVNNRRPKTNFRLANDLVADNFMRLPWIPIGKNDSTAFQGTFDGGGHVISMLQTEEPVAGCGYRGLFGAIGKGGSVTNVTLAACDMRGWDNIGAVAGVNEGTVSNCHVAFSIMSSIGSGMNLGGICGLNRGTISGCTTRDDVWVGGARDYAGGICGTNDGGSLTGNTSQAICGSGSDAELPATASEKIE